LGTAIIEFDWPGVEVQHHYTNMAGETQTHLIMNDVKIPEKNILAQGDGGFKKQLNALNWERLGGAADVNASAGCALSKALDYAQTRKQFGQPIGDFQGIEWKLAEMVKEYASSRALIYRAARKAKKNDCSPSRLDTSMAMLSAAKTADRIVDEALQIHGANGFQKGHPLEYLYRLVRGTRIGGGTDEIQKNSIASELKKHGVPNLT
jgi:alkylation response protein AidB-like acyl-CoA dehydrogenase